MELNKADDRGAIAALSSDCIATMNDMPDGSPRLLGCLACFSMVTADDVLQRFCELWRCIPRLQQACISSKVVIDINQLVDVELCDLSQCGSLEACLVSSHAVLEPLETNENEFENI